MIIFLLPPRNLGSKNFASQSTRTRLRKAIWCQGGWVHGMLIVQHAMGSGRVVIFVHPPVLSSAPIGDRNHGYATAHNGLTCGFVRGVSQNIS